MSGPEFEFEPDYDDDYCAYCEALSESHNDMLCRLASGVPGVKAWLRDNATYEAAKDIFDQVGWP